MEFRQNKFKIFLIFLTILLGCNILFADETVDENVSADNKITSNLSGDTIKLGQKITLTTKITNLPNQQALWQDVSISDNNFEIVSTVDRYERNVLVLEIVFTSFNMGEYSDLFFTIPLKSADGQMNYIETAKVNVNVYGEVGQADLDNMMNMIQNESDLDKIELKPVKPQAKFNYNFKAYVKWIVFGILMILVCAIGFYFLWNYILKKKNKQDDKPKIPPFDAFVATIEMLEFSDNESRLQTELKLSQLTEALKALITGETEINASSETTRELIVALKNADFKQEWTNIINKTFNEIDMIKFAKAEYETSALNIYKEEIKKLGFDIHKFNKSQEEPANEGGEK